MEQGPQTQSSSAHVLTQVHACLTCMPCHHAVQGKYPPMCSTFKLPKRLATDVYARLMAH